ncbi:DUF3576 domain-containing protein [Candidatus Pelagibacter sp.]|uniref:DUF3576 domain-containing protein n=1 Tax=Candidatus Pelagibacter sp. TaxID=2024849 RepID=UPI003F86B2B7
MTKFFKSSIIFFLIILFFNSCGIYRPVDTRKVPINANERTKKNIQQGKGFTLFDSQKNKGSGNFEFASSNPMWRASIKLLDFTPFSNVDYAGGIIITDWFNNDDANSNESIKITVKFLSNEVRADGINVLIYKKICNTNSNNCTVSKIDSDLSNEIKLAILKEAAIIKEFEDSQIVRPDFQMPGEGTDNNQL